MTPLRFRVHKLKADKVYGAGEIAYEGEDLALIGDCYQNVWEDDEDEEKAYAIVQSTGLTDRKGKLIFGGDIVRGPDGVIVQVIWERGSFVFSGQGVKSSFDATVSIWLARPDKVEIIGNVHQNPEFLAP